MHDYRAIFLDIDGTLTQPGHSAPPVSAVVAIESARRLGRRVFLCTGRCEAMLKPLLHCADFDGYVASSGGLVVVGGRDVFDCPMTPQEQAHVLTALSDGQLSCPEGRLFCALPAGQTVLIPADFLPFTLSGGTFFISAPRA